MAFGFQCHILYSIIFGLNAFTTVKNFTLSHNGKMAVVYWFEMFQCKSCPFSSIYVVIAGSEEQLDLQDEINDDDQ